jgi:hypothetical protein
VRLKIKIDKTHNRNIYHYTILTEPEQDKEEPVVMLDRVKRDQAFYFIKGVMTYRWLVSSEVKVHDFLFHHNRMLTHFAKNAREFIMNAATGEMYFYVEV